MIIESQFIKHYSRIDYSMLRRKKELIILFKQIKLEEENDKLKVFREKLLKKSFHLLKLVYYWKTLNPKNRIWINYHFILLLMFKSF